MKISKPATRVLENGERTSTHSFWVTISRDNSYRVSTGLRTYEAAKHLTDTLQVAADHAAVNKPFPDHIAWTLRGMYPWLKSRLVRAGLTFIEMNVDDAIDWYSSWAVEGKSKHDVIRAVRTAFAAAGIWWLCDIDPEKLAQCATSIGAKRQTSWFTNSLHDAGFIRSEQRFNFNPYDHEIITAVLAFKTHGPVKIIVTRNTNRTLSNFRQGHYTNDLSVLAFFHGDHAAKMMLSLQPCSTDDSWYELDGIHELLDGAFITAYGEQRLGIPASPLPTTIQDGAITSERLAILRSISDRRSERRDKSSAVHA